MMKLLINKLPQLVCVALLLSYSANGFATQFNLDQWRTEYPDSTSSDIRCQLCHVLREGGDPWNAYGRDIRNQFRSLDPATRTIEQAFRLVEQFNSDGDTPVVTNLSEINANTQPGWRSGQVNLAYNRDDQTLGPFREPTAVDPIPEPIVDKEFSLQITEIADGFTAPTGAVAGPTAELRNQLFVLDQVGLVWRVNMTTGEKSEYIDVRGKIVQLGAFEAGGYDERGLLGFAFHPNFANNGRLYLYLSEDAVSTADFSTLDNGLVADHQSVILELVVSNITDTSGAAVIGSQRELLRVDQPQFNHNGGALIFDADEFLYITFGDGGNADDQGSGHGQDGNGSDPSNPLGSILRIDPLGNNSANGAYGIPTSNPFIDNPEVLSETFAYGFRNPWKLSFDTAGRLYVADVGQNDIEEINLVEKGQHYGWPFKEGDFFFDPNGESGGIVTRVIPNNLPGVSLIDPVLQYDHDEGISVIGGYVYQGNSNPPLFGKYIFGDFLKRLFVGDLNSREIFQIDLVPDVFVFGFAQDNAGELYFMGNETAGTSGAAGKLFKLESTIEEDEGDFCFPVITNPSKAAVVCL